VSVLQQQFWLLPDHWVLYYENIIKTCSIWSEVR
jgi:hypothetical protein